MRLDLEYPLGSLSYPPTPIVVGYPDGSNGVVTSEPRTACFACGSSVAISRRGTLRNHHRSCRDGTCRRPGHGHVTAWRGDGIWRSYYGRCEGSRHHVLCFWPDDRPRELR